MTQTPNTESLSTLTSKCLGNVQSESSAVNIQYAQHVVEAAERFITGFKGPSLVCVLRHYNKSMRL